MATRPTELEIFWISGSPYSWRVLLALEIKQLKYRSHLLEASKEEHKKPEFLALNPRGKAPVLKDGDTVLYESLAIMAYLDRQYSQPQLFGQTAEETGRVWRQISEYSSYLDGPLNRVVLPIYFDKVADKKEDIRAAAKSVHTELARWEEGIGDAPWLCGISISAADVAVYPFLKSLCRAASKETAAPLQLGFLPFESRYPRLAAWMGRLERLPGYERTYPPHWRT
ncbi:MAG: glutathione S-transferase family protein [Sulfuricaulis sp.]|nr:glutathione S-transferase family protein [Sulfuricaulis sp.]